MNSGRTLAATYRIVVRGELGDQFAVVFDGMALERADGTTVLTGRLRDQAQLAGLIERLQELGIEIISLTELDGPSPS